MKKSKRKNPRLRGDPVAKQVVKLKPQTHKDRKKEAKKNGNLCDHGRRMIDDCMGCRIELGL